MAPAGPSGAGVTEGFQTEGFGSRCDALKEAGLIESKPQGRTSLLTVTDKGWAHASAHLGDFLAQKVIRDDLLPRLLTFWEQGRISLKDILTGAALPLPPSSRPPPELIREAYLKIGGRFSTRVRLSDLRAALDVDRATLDQTLIEMMRSRALTLYGLDYGRDITAADEAAALVVGGRPTYVVIIDQ